MDVLETSDSEESESENEVTTVDECVKCVCEDECELGFMIQVCFLLTYSVHEITCTYEDTNFRT